MLFISKNPTRMYSFTRAGASPIFILTVVHKMRFKGMDECGIDRNSSFIPHVFMKILVLFSGFYSVICLVRVRSVL